MSGTGRRRPAKLRAAAWRQQRGVLHRLLPQPQLGIWHRFAPSDPGNDPLFHSPLLAEADFLACQADANEQLDLARADSRRLASSEHYPLHKLRQIHSALRQRQLNLPLWLLSEYADRRYAGYQRPLFRGALLMDNLLGVADQVWLAGFWLNSGLQAKLAPTASSIPPAWRCTICTACRARFTGYSGSGGGCAADHGSR